MKALPLLALALLCLLLTACSQGGPAAPTVEPIAEPAATPSGAPTDTLTAVPTATTPSAPGAPTPERGLLVPTPTPRVGRPYTRIPSDAASATLEEFIFRSDVIARVSLLSVAAKGKTVPSGEGVAPTYEPMQELRFRVLQGGYLKGSGGSEITVEVLDVLGHTYVSEWQASRVAQSWLEDRNTTWDGREAVVFLERHASTAPNYRFTKALAYGRDYAVDSLDPAWLPVDTAPTGTQGASDPVFLSGPAPEGNSAMPTIALAGLQSKIAAVTAELAAGAGIAGYEECVRRRIEYERWDRAYEAFYGSPYVIPAAEHRVTSGLPAGTEFRNLDYGSYGYPRVWLSGADAERFQVVAPGGPDSSVLSYRTGRPLPGGVYRFVDSWQHRDWVPCNFAPNPEQEWTVTVIAPAGAVHEAFFDPADLTPGAGFSASSGVLEPAGFTVGGTAASITGLKWRNGSVVLTLAPYAFLSGHTLDFIALDGSVDPSLAVSSATADSAAGTLTWAVPVQPWRDGDQLMLRIRRVGVPATATPTPTAG